MEKTTKRNEEIGHQIKKLLLIYNLVMTSAANINEFNTSEISLTEDMKNEHIQNFIKSFQNATYQKPSNVNNITNSFINLISNILSYSYISNVSTAQFLSAYYLVHIFHKDSSEEDIQKNKKSLNITLNIGIADYSDYVKILEMINLLEDEKDNDINTQFQNKCQLIKNLNIFELNANISTFLLEHNEIPQYKNIDFPKLDSNDDKNTFINKIKEIATLLDVINSSLKMNTENIRFELYNKYITQNDKLNAINKVLSSLKKKKLYSLNIDDLSLRMELFKENCAFLKNENIKGNQIIENLQKMTNQYENEVNTLNEKINDLNEKIEVLSKNLKNTNQELSKEKKKNKDLNNNLMKQEQNLEDLFNELQNIKYRDISNCVIDYFVCILSDEDYEVAMNSEYKDAVKYIIKEINNSNYVNYKNLLTKEGIDIEVLFKVLLKHKREYNTVTHGDYKEEEEFIRLIIDFENDEMGNKFKLLFNKTPLLKKYCFDKRNHITRFEIQEAMLKVNF